MTTAQAIHPNTVAEINGLPHKALVYRFSGTVVSCYERKSGTNAKGEWSIQNAIVRDAAGENIKVMLNGLPQQNWPDGAAIELGTWEGPKGHSGLYAEDDSYNDETKRILRATKTCAINIASSQEAAENAQGYPDQEPPQQQLDHDTRSHEPQATDDDIPWGDSEPSGTQAQPPQPQAQPQQTAPAQPQQQANLNAGRPANGGPANSDVALTRAKHEIVKIANLHLTCAIIVDRMNAPMHLALTGQPMSESQRQGAIASVFIKAERSGLVNDMPLTPLGVDDFKSV